MDLKKAIVDPKILLLLVVAGLLLIKGSWFSGANSPPASPVNATAVDKSSDPNQSGVTDYEKYYTDKLTDMLNKMQGVSDATVLVNIDATEEVTYATQGNSNKSTTSESDKNGGTRTTTTSSDTNTLVMVKGANGDVPVVVKKTKPQIAGVWIEARGVTDPGVRNRIETAIVRVLNIPAHRISINEKQ